MWAVKAPLKRSEWITRTRLFDLDDFGSKISEEHARVGASDERTLFDYTYT
ncbi:hypothetical protein D3C80_2130840 [compost metagenome]